MIKEIFYTDNRTYIRDEKDNEISTDSMSFTEAFKLAKTVNVKIDFEDLTKVDTVEFSKYLEKNNNSRNISLFFIDLREAGLKQFREENEIFIATQNTITKAIEDYNNCGYIDEAGKYIIQTLKQTKNNTIIKLLEEEEYDLDVFIYECKKINKEEKIIKLKEKFNDEFGCSTQALDDYVEYLSTFGGDYTSYIADAFNKCFDALIDDEPFCDRDGLIEYLEDLEV